MIFWRYDRKKICTLKSIVHVNRLVGICIEHIPKLTMSSKNVDYISKAYESIYNFYMYYSYSLAEKNKIK